MNEKELNFEQGPIRPPNEARSLLLRITRNCPWNQCLFCPVYKKRKFSLRTIDEIKEDIQTARDMADDIKALARQLGDEGRRHRSRLSAIFSTSPQYNDAYRSIAAWMYYGTGACFLQDADNLILPTKDLVEILIFFERKIPGSRSGDNLFPITHRDPQVG